MMHLASVITDMFIPFVKKYASKLSQMDFIVDLCENGNMYADECSIYTSLVCGRLLNVLLDHIESIPKTVSILVFQTLISNSKQKHFDSRDSSVETSLVCGLLMDWDLSRRFCHHQQTMIDLFK
eukprot:TRINITY_DN6164_c0_g1_i3.p1 TRINITY_DN6164_c0_g1~~TRINITY_DN6164_c0_g1_i3.p1  ORF type:complete len:124 (-),score=6.38 TRINITY_DN6164_c0_g1_i3:37-408(-)